MLTPTQTAPWPQQRGGGMSLSHTLHAVAEPIWRKTLHHPFVVGIGNGSLPIEKFRFYMCQDYIFLIEYSRVLALATAKAPDLGDMQHFARLLDATLNQEMALHREFAANCGITADRLAATPPAPTTHAYTSHLLRVAALGDLAEIVCVLLPCQWGYSEIGQSLSRLGTPAGQLAYARWIEMYASADFAELSRWLRGVLDRLAPTAEHTGRLDRLRSIFVTSSRYEYLFWDMAYQTQDWLV